MSGSARRLGLRVCESGCAHYMLSEVPGTQPTGQPGKARRPRAPAPTAVPKAPAGRVPRTLEEFA